ncbi:hypothetical protein [Paraburkholderia sp. DHOC27]|uniref:hypothetical protein n=1 Tax=Paraburkholderia sp. DHOC27 TaxID=2303330 RepID=UPI000E3E8BBA|nr:hypothetical protein [Paraburkholderia sp. DHOC27]RFU48747.1 hypothetical protein D0B32_02615 [Paraburkholderia sp. DHOC27]
MADSAASTQSRTTRGASTRRRTNTVSTETENKLARAARSAQRLAQLSDVSRDDSTLDLFPDDPTRATLEAMNIDIRQGTLHGFELPDVVLAAVGAGADGAAAQSEAKAARRVARERSDAPAVASFAGFERIEPAALNEATADGAPMLDAAAEAMPVTAQGAVGAQDAAVDVEREVSSSAPASVVMTSAMAAATVARSVAALRQAAESSGDAGATGATGGLPSQRFATKFAKAATASREMAVNATGKVAGSADVGEAGANPAVQGASANLMADTVDTTDTVGNPAEHLTASAASSLVGSGTANPPANPVPEGDGAPQTAAMRANAAKARDASDDAIAGAGLKASAPFVVPPRDAARTAPELDRARATAFADTVDALYGVISDQRRAATDHSRRMKWMLSIVVAALLATVAIGVTQTMLLMRLTRETTAQQHRIEEMMQTQQAAMTSLLDAHLAMANAPVATQPAAVAPVTAAPPHQTQPGAATALAGKRGEKTRVHPHKPKAVGATTR